MMGRAVVFGLARSGVGAASLLVRMGMNVTVTDIRPKEELAEYIGKLPPGVEVLAGGHPDGLLDGADLVVLSPGVPTGVGAVRSAIERGIEVIGEFELATRALDGVPVYAVTGTNGKSTTVTLLDLMMKKSGRISLLAGNIGNSLAAEVASRGNGLTGLAGIDCVVAEVSSFQLETIVNFRPAGAAVLNITPDHMDRYHSMEEYVSAKARISLNQRQGDFLVLNADDPLTAGLEEEATGHGARVYFFSRRHEVNGVFLKGSTLYFGRDPLVKAAEIGIKGTHNLENAMAAASVALLAGCPPEPVADALCEFRGLEHRLEFVREREGVRYINDSKGTNVGAAIKSVESFAEPIVLIAGGRDKAGEFGELAEACRGRVKAAVLIGEAREKIGRALSPVVRCEYAGDLGAAVSVASSIASAGDVVLLSPACASFDMFENFEHRGREFKRMVAEL